MDKHIYGTRKHYSIKNRRRFILSITILFLVGFIIFSVTSGKRYARGDRGGCPYITVVVKDGDTLWSIARSYKSKENEIRQFIREIREINSLESANVISGEHIQIPLN